LLLRSLPDYEMHCPTKQEDIGPQILNPEYITPNVPLVSLTNVPDISLLNVPLFTGCN